MACKAVFNMEIGVEIECLKNSGITRQDRKSKTKTMIWLRVTEISSSSHHIIARISASQTIYPLQRGKNVFLPWHPHVGPSGCGIPISSGDIHCMSIYNLYVDEMLVSIKEISMTDI